MASPNVMETRNRMPKTKSKQANKRWMRSGFRRLTILKIYVRFRIHFSIVCWCSNNSKLSSNGSFQVFFSACFEPLLSTRDFFFLGCLTINSLVIFFTSILRNSCVTIKPLYSTLGYELKCIYKTDSIYRKTYRHLHTHHRNTIDTRKPQFQNKLNSIG